MRVHFVSDKYSINEYHSSLQRQIVRLFDFFYFYGRHRMRGRPLYFAAVLSFSNVIIGNHHTELDQTSSHVRKWAIFEKLCKNVGVTPHKRGALLLSGEITKFTLQWRRHYDLRANNKLYVSNKTSYEQMEMPFKPQRVPYIFQNLANFGSHTAKIYVDGFDPLSHCHIASVFTRRSPNASQTNFVKNVRKWSANACP